MSTLSMPAVRPNRWLVCLCVLGALSSARDARAQSEEDATQRPAVQPPEAEGSDDVAHAETPEPDEDPPGPGQVAFIEGVERSRQGDWAGAAAAFHRSLGIEDRPATRYNLARVHAELQQPLEAARHALAFLRLPRSPHRSDARAELEQLLAEALHSLAILDLHVTPEDAAVRVDSEPLDVLDENGRAYLKAGRHRITVHAPGHLPFESERLLPSGQVTSIAVALALEPPPATTIVKTRALRWRRPLALSLAATGTALWLAGLGTYAAAEAKQDEVAALDPQQRGSLPKAERYRGLRRAAGPLTLMGGAMQAAGALVSEKAPARRWGWVALATGTGLAAAGLAMAIPEPDRVGMWNTEAPTRALGFVLVGAALPCLGLGVRWLWRPGRRNAHMVASPFGVRGTF